MKIADIEFGKYPVFLAPMEDVTDAAFRLLCKRFGVDMVYTEFVSMLSQTAVDEQILPLGVGESESGASEFLMDEDPVALIDALVPFCVSGLL